MSRFPATQSDGAEIPATEQVLRLHLVEAVAVVRRASGMRTAAGTRGGWMKGFASGVIATIAALAALVFAVANLGLFPIGADNPPGRVERMLASRAMNVYADKHKPAGDNPIPPLAANLIQGALKYEEHCAVCHGGAKAKISALQNQFSPPAPQLINRIPHDPPSWLFWVTQHGVRMTGMPAWAGVLSDEDIWKIVAFIKNSATLPPEAQAAWQVAAKSE